MSKQNIRNLHEKPLQKMLFGPFSSKMPTGLFPGTFLDICSSLPCSLGFSHDVDCAELHKGLPFANTCANHLVIPVTSIYQNLKEVLLNALEIGCIFSNEQIYSTGYADIQLMIYTHIITLFQQYGPVCGDLWTYGLHGPVCVVLVTSQLVFKSVYPMKLDDFILLLQFTLCS